MPDQEINDEIRKNQQRQAENEANAEDDGPIVDTFEKAINPLVNAIDDTPGENVDGEDLQQRRKRNDAAQRPD